MEMSDLKTPRPIDPSKIMIDDIINDLFHDVQNSIHRVGMELELASMGLADKSDAAKTAEMTKSLEITSETYGLISARYRTPPPLATRRRFWKALSRISKTAAAIRAFRLVGSRRDRCRLWPCTEDF